MAWERGYLRTTLRGLGTRLPLTNFGFCSSLPAAAAQAPLDIGLREITIEDKTGQLLGALVLSTGDNLLVCACVCVCVCYVVSL